MALRSNSSGVRTVSITNEEDRAVAMVTLQIFEQYLNGRFATATCATEPEYYALWHSAGIDALSPPDMAVAGALLADRLAWVFTAGYQATLRNAFTQLPAGGWAAFAATEDPDDPDAHPGTTLAESDGGLVLRGYKSWVAHSRLVEHLIVTVNDPAGDKYRTRGLVVERGSEGVHLTHRTNPGFLGAMSQGFAHFDETPIDPGAVFEFEAIRQFGRTEAKFVMLACTAFMLDRCGSAHDLRDRLFSVAAALLALIAEQDTSRQVYATIDRGFQRCVDLFESGNHASGIVDYAHDRRLFRMYTQRIQRRADYAKAEAQ